jgi:hypothetical protein
MSHRWRQTAIALLFAAVTTLIAACADHYRNPQDDPANQTTTTSIVTP